MNAIEQTRTAEIARIYRASGFHAPEARRLAQVAVDAELVAGRELPLPLRAPFGPPEARRQAEARWQRMGRGEGGGHARK